MGDGNDALAQIGSVIDNPAPRWRIHVEKSGRFQARKGSKLGVRLDFQSVTGHYSRSVLFQDKLYDSQTSTLPWNTVSTAPGETNLQRALDTERPFEINLARLAPTDWNRKRVTVTFLLQNTGRYSQAKFTLTRS
jgi:hypothetical protein